MYQIKLIKFRYSAIIILNLLIALSTASYAAKIEMTDYSNELGGLLWLPCELGRCLIDTGGRGGGLLAITPKTKMYPKLKTITIQTLRGPMECDLLMPIKLELANKIYISHKMIRCEEFPANLSPLLGLDFFQRSQFSFLFSTMSFKWEYQVENIKPIKLDKTDGWIGMTGRLLNKSVRIVFDTGAPTTLVDEVFVDDNPELFDDVSYTSSVPGIRLVAPKVNLTVDGIVLSQKPWRVEPISKTFKTDYQPHIMLGMNLIKYYDWHFDLGAGEVWIKPIPKIKEHLKF